MSEYSNHHDPTCQAVAYGESSNDKMRLIESLKLARKLGEPYTQKRYDHDYPDSKDGSLKRLVRDLRKLGAEIELPDFETYGGSHGYILTYVPDFNSVELTESEKAAYYKTEWWKVKSRERKDFDGNKCQQCHGTRDPDSELVTHHLTYGDKIDKSKHDMRSVLFNECHVTQLITLCELCHSDAHRRPNPPNLNHMTFDRDEYLWYCEKCKITERDAEPFGSKPIGEKKRRHRTWVSTDPISGDVSKVKAVMVEMRSFGVVIVEAKEDSKLHDLPVANLSKKDQDYVEGIVGGLTPEPINPSIAEMMTKLPRKTEQVNASVPRDLFGEIETFSEGDPEYNYS